MDNLWFVDDNQPYVSWSALLTHLRGRPDDLLAWTQEVVRIGAATRVLVPVSIPRYDARGSDAIDRLLAGLAERCRQGELDLFDFAGFGARYEGNLIYTRLGVADRDGSVRECMAGRVADLPRSIWRSEDGTPDVFDGGYFFLDVSGCGVFTPQRLAESGYATGDHEIDVTFGLYTDIWLPWIPNARPEQPGVYFDNRPLANVHTPGLNQFLARVKDLTVSLGGRWEYEVLGHPSMAREIGIDLEWLPPNHGT